jgi:hypothetical protein
MCPVNEPISMGVGQFPRVAGGLARRIPSFSKWILRHFPPVNRRSM